MFNILVDISLTTMLFNILTLLENALESNTLRRHFKKTIYATVHLVFHLTYFLGTYSINHLTFLFIWPSSKEHMCNNVCYRLHNLFLLFRSWCHRWIDRWRFILIFLFTHSHKFGPMQIHVQPVVYFPSNEHKIWIIFHGLYS